MTTVVLPNDDYVYVTFDWLDGHDPIAGWLIPADMYYSDLSMGELIKDRDARTMPLFHDEIVEIKLNSVILP